MLALAVLSIPSSAGSQAAPTRNTWEKEYAQRSADSIAAQFEEPSRAVFRYRHAIAGLMQLKPGMTAIEIGAGSGFLARELVKKVGPEGRVVATELEEKLVVYMNERAKKEGLTNFVALKGQPAATGLEPESADALVMVNTFSFIDKPADMLKSVNATLKPKGLLLIVDFPREGLSASSPGMDAEEVVELAKNAGFDRAGENGVVPGQYALIFRKR